MNQHLSLSEDLSGENSSNKMINPLERTLLNTNDTSMSQPNSPMPNFDISVQVSNPEQNQEYRYTDTFCCCFKRLIQNCFIGLIIDSFNSGLLSDDNP